MSLVAYALNVVASLLPISTTTSPAFETKPILNVLDDEPVIYPEQLLLWKWISDYYMCTEGEVMNAALPAHLKLSSEMVITVNEEYGDLCSPNDLLYLG